MELKRIVINGVDTDYFISEDGNVFHDGKPLSLRVNPVTGYTQVTLKDKNMNRYCINIHRYVALAFVPNPNNLPVVNHIDGNKTNNHYTNLEWTTVIGNMQHALRTGLIKHCPLDLDTVKNIAVLLYNKTPVKKIAKMFDIDKSLVEQVANSEYYKNYVDEHDSHSNKIKCLNKAERCKINKNVYDDTDDVFPDKITLFNSLTDYNTNDIEVWSDYLIIDGYKTSYRVSNYGRIMNEASHMILHPIVDKTGLLKISLYVSETHTHYSKLLHRLVAIAFVKDGYDEKKEIRFKDGNKLNCRSTNLEWISVNERRREIQANGGKYGCQKLTEADVHKICQMLESGTYTAVEIGIEFGVTSATIKRIKAGKIWTHISSQYNIPKPVKHDNQNNFAEHYEEIDKLILAGADTATIIEAVPMENATRESYRSIINQRRRFYKNNGTLKDIRKE